MNVDAYLPKIPDFIYECMNKKGPELEELRQVRVAEAMILNQPAEDFSEAILHWNKTTSLLSKFEYREPNQEEWHSLTQCFVSHPEIGALIKKYPNFYIERLTEKTATLLQYVENWPSWIKLNKFALTEYLEVLPVFNMLELHPDLSNHAKAFKGDLEAFKEELSSRTYNNPNAWVYYNPYAVTAEAKDNWLVFLAPHVPIKPDTLIRLYKSNKLPLEHFCPSVYLDSYTDRAEKECIKLMEESTIYREKVLKYLMESSEAGFTRDSKPNLTYTHNGIKVAAESLKKNWASNVHCSYFLKNCYNSSFNEIWNAAKIHYSKVIDQEWQALFASHPYNFIEMLDANQFLQLKPTANELYIYHKKRSDPIILEALKKNSKQLNISLLKDEDLIQLMKQDIVKLSFDTVFNATQSTKSSWTKNDLWIYWLASMKPHMKPKEYRALTLYVIQQDPSMRNLAKKYPTMADKVLECVI